MRLLRTFTGAVLLFLVLPVLAVVPLSLSSSELLTLPIPGLSLRWYEVFFTDGRWLAATRTSLVVGGLTALLATVLGTLAALGLQFGRVPGRAVLLGLLTAPVVVPSVVTGLAMYLAFAPAGLTSTLPGLVLAHTVLAAPYAVTTVLAGLQGFDPVLLRAASSLGAPPATALRRVLAPLLAPSIVTGAVFAFAISFDELIVTLFIAGPDQVTLPRQMFAGLREVLSPTLSAAAVVLAAASVGLLALVQVVRRQSGGA